MQLMLTNPITLVGAAYVAWNFFKDRIEYEEETLVKYFKQDYIRYRAQTPVGIPLIK
jgi:protein-S-isoprenylcysteine O-methyltransferase